MLITFGFLTPTTLVIVLVIALIIFGPGKLPELGRGLGQGIKEFRESAQELQELSDVKVNSKD
ncbi:twin arginine-targeting protein translocase, TatA/E family [Desulfosporosinus orientis DSM 765]|uniref:Sec-independent protein translocase protein TatA n=1 Tax=Desulfosporosinus orientis (strain ATCC 19365 / DSM 765 / NCIMB 8382 / VKM B-1628 / Singapore I) TaxID=768706 RepID=G7W9F2_DESOD|nr:twin-arginine translocase TatA/TatE family subunit [Desulfosporosinus orientis]AET69289.1 twin arginine-targeting protein translocase, TatA/E family [Desulfosporosinus orientis DSM 765]